MSRPRIVLIAALARNGVIGRDQGLPWQLPGDMAHFRERTRGRPVLMGRKTWDSLPPRFRPLPGRLNLVLSRDPAWQVSGAERVTSLQAALDVAQAQGASELMVIGGGQVYALALPQADELVLTEVDADIEGDTRFPEGWMTAFTCTARQAIDDPAASHPYAIGVWQRRSA